MVIALVDAEDVREDTVQPTEAAVPKEEIIDDEEQIEDEEEGESQTHNGLKVVLDDVFDLTTGGIEMHGFERHILVHPTKDYDVEYFVKGSDVIMVDYHDTNSLNIEVLERKEADLIINELNS